MNRFMDVTAQPEYDIQFWAEMRSNVTDRNVIDKAVLDVTGGYKLPASDSGKLSEVILYYIYYQQNYQYIQYNLHIALPLY